MVVFNMLLECPTSYIYYDGKCYRSAVDEDMDLYEGAKEQCRVEGETWAGGGQLQQR